MLPRGYAFSPRHPNSIETVVRTFATHTRHKVMVFADGQDNEAAISTRHISGRNRRQRIAALVQELRAFEPDLIEAHQHIPTAHKLATALKNVPVLLVRHNVDKEPTNPIRKWWHGRRLRTFAGIAFVSHYLRNAFLARHPELTHASHVVQNAIDTAPWHAKVAGKEKLIVYSGRATKAKGFDAFCAAMAILMDRHTNWRVEICALAYNDQRAFADEAMAPLRAFGNRLTLHADQPMDKVRNVVKRAAIAVIPSRTQEAFGLVALEAHAAGCAVITSGRGGLLEASGDHAVVLDTVSSAAIADACDGLITAPDKRKALAKAGQAFVEGAHSLQNRTTEWDDLRSKIAVRKR